MKKGQINHTHYHNFTGDNYFNEAMQKSYPTAGKTVTLFIRMFLVVLLLIIPYLIYKYISPDRAEYGTFDIYAITIINVLAEIWLIWYAIKRIKKTEEFNLLEDIKPRSISLIPYVILTTLTLGLLLEPIQQLIPMQNSFEEMFTLLMNQKLLAFSYVSLIGPVIEEIIFRGIILKSFLKNYNPLKAILLSALFFGGIHFNLPQFFGGFVIGCFLGFVYWQTRSLFLCIVIHVFNNTVALLVANIFGANMTTETLINSTALYLAIYLLAALLFSYSLLQIFKKTLFNRDLPF